MNFESWSVNLVEQMATHSSGFKVTVEGDPANPNAVYPECFPESLSAVEQARLLRCGVKAIMEEAQQNKPKRFIHAGQLKPKRPVLSLNRAKLEP